MRPLWLVLVASLLVALAVILTRDPEEAWALAVVIVATGVAVGAAAILLLLRQTRARGRRAPRLRRAPALRRGAEVAAVVILLLWLRAVDGLSVITAAFVVLAFVVAEMILSARPHSSR